MSLLAIKGKRIARFVVGMSTLALVGFYATNASAVAKFWKHGDNGTAPCSTYCASDQWPGGVGTCVSARISPTSASIPCNLAVGLLTAAELSCECQLPRGDFLKDGNNGTAPCAYYCEHLEFPGGTGTCVTSWRTDTNTPVLCGLGTGLLPVNTQLTCQCRAD